MLLFDNMVVKPLRKGMMHYSIHKVSFLNLIAQNSFLNF